MVYLYFFAAHARLPRRVAREPGWCRRHRPRQQCQQFLRDIMIDFG